MLVVLTKGPSPAKPKPFHLSAHYSLNLKCNHCTNCFVPKSAPETWFICCIRQCQASWEGVRVRARVQGADRRGGWVVDRALSCTHTFKPGSLCS